MTKEILITIEGLQSGAGEEPVIQRFPGTYHYINGSHYIQYEEERSENSIETKNMIKITPEQVALSKKGEQHHTQMVFDLNEITKTTYLTAYGSMLFDIKTESIRLEEKPDELVLKMVYSLSADDEHISDNTIKIFISST